MECEERGIEPNTVLVSSTVDYEHPTVSNLTKYLIASDAPESMIICKAFEDYKDFGKEPVRTETAPKMAMAGVSSSYIYPDEDDFGYPPY